jgi:S-adenosylmethionine synthetase
MSNRNHPRAAEDILPGHPDRICDAIAEQIVAIAHKWDAEALVGVEVALHRNVVYLTGRVAAGSQGRDSGFPPPINIEDMQLESVVSKQFESAGYRGIWQHKVRVETDLDVGGLIEGEREIRRFSDDQGMAVGYADPDGINHLPLEVAAARRVKRALAGARDAHSELLGPDGKVLVRLTPGQRPALEHVNISIQHTAGLGFEDLYRLVLPYLTAAFDDLATHLELPAIRGESFRLNGIGDFTCGGPMGDNGLSGKKLVVDHYGPHVPIGGGAICGKDAHKPDRVGALRARQVACRAANATGMPATVHLGYLPGLEAPDRLWVEFANGEMWSRERTEAHITVPDMTLAGTAHDLELAGQDWPSVMRHGYMGNNWRWDS